MRRVRRFIDWLLGRKPAYAYYWWRISGSGSQDVTYVFGSERAAMATVRKLQLPVGAFELRRLEWGRDTAILRSLSSNTGMGIALTEDESDE